VRIAASCFTLFAFNELKDALSEIAELKMIFTQPTYTKSDYISDAGKREQRQFFIPKRERESSLFGTDFEIRLCNKMSLKAIAKECARWVEKRCDSQAIPRVITCTSWELQYWATDASHGVYTE